MLLKITEDMQKINPIRM